MFLILIAQLKQLEFIPVTISDAKSNNRVNKKVSLAKQSVFFASKDKKQTDKFYSLIEPDLCLVDLNTLLCLDELKNAQIVAALKSLGVRDATRPSDVIEHHIMVEFERESKSVDALVDYLVYIAWHSQTTPIDFERLRNVVRLKVNTGLVKTPSDVFSTPLYGNRLDLMQMFPLYATDRCQFVDPVYMKRSRELSKSMPAKLEDLWKRFWANLGLAETLTPKLKQTRVASNDDWALVCPEFVFCKHQLDELTANQIYLFNDYEFDLVKFYADLAENNSGNLFFSLF